MGSASHFRSGSMVDGRSLAVGPILLATYCTCRTDRSKIISLETATSSTEAIEAKRARNRPEEPSKKTLVFSENSFSCLFSSFLSFSTCALQVGDSNVFWMPLEGIWRDFARFKLHSNRFPRTNLSMISHITYLFSAWRQSQFMRIFCQNSSISCFSLWASFCEKLFTSSSLDPIDGLIDK